MDPVEYTKYNTVTIALAKNFIHEMMSTIDLWDGRNQLVMDLGCGTGNSSTMWIAYYFPNIEKFIGVDFDPEMIALAKEHNDFKNREFYVADIMDSDSLKAWKGSVCRLFSHFVLHRVKDQKHAFKNIFDLLRPKGEACLHFILQCPYYSSCMDLHKTAKWKPILETTNQVFPESFIKNYDSSCYKQMFEDVGFRVQICEIKTLEYVFKSDEECKNLLVSLHSLGNVSDELKEEYKNDLFEQFLKHSPRDSEGKPTYHPKVLVAKLDKD